MSNKLADLRGWTEFYSSLGIDCDFSTLAIPKNREGFGRLVIVVKGATVGSTFDECARRCRGSFRFWKYTENLDEAVSVNERSSSKGSYAIWVRDLQSDLATKNLSALHLEGNLPTETLLERLLHGWKYFIETGKHLDYESTVTLCAGSRGYFEGKLGVPMVNFYEGRLGVDLCFLTSHGHNLAAREVMI